MSEPTHHRRGGRAAFVLFLVLAVAVCISAAIWQYRVWQHGGTFQNLGYVFQWPIIGGFLVYTYRRYVALEDRDRELAELTELEENASGNSPDVPAARRRAPATGASTAAPTELPEEFLPNYRRRGASYTVGPSARRPGTSERSGRPPSPPWDVSTDDPTMTTDARSPDDRPTPHTDQ